VASLLICRPRAPEPRASGFKVCEGRDLTLSLSGELATSRLCANDPFNVRYAAGLMPAKSSIESHRVRGLILRTHHQPALAFPWQNAATWNYRDGASR
jgi:hypothetical protein